MLKKIPTEIDMTKLVGQSLFDVWRKLCAVIEGKYDMNRTWNSGGKK